ncbi:MAG: hypothetical protein WCD12_16070 [Candidatus Binatus sp.]|jgi:hypothetical protein|uniref:hypothetical protein n=1 Tax=Candidatus Binatus sp. TaxID=2811406 RepID=UPI003C782B70
MNIAKTLAVVACAALLSTGVLSSAHRAYAQDADDSLPDTGSWGAVGADSADEAASPDSKAPPIDIQGCWDGDVSDKADGTGDAFFGFTQDGKTIVGDDNSGVDLEWGDGSFAESPIQGTVSSKGIKFHGKAGSGCPFHGTGKGDASELSGKITFGGKCSKFFKNVRFSVSPGPC